MLVCHASVILPVGVTAAARAARTNGIGIATAASAALCNNLRRVSAAVFISASLYFWNFLLS